MNGNFLIRFSKIEFPKYLPSLRICPFLCLCCLDKVSLCNVIFPPWVEPFICIDFILSYKHIHIERMMFADHKEILIFHIVQNRVDFTWIKQFVDEIKVEVKSFSVFQIGLKLFFTFAFLS